MLNSSEILEMKIVLMAAGCEVEYESCAWLFQISLQNFFQAIDRAKLGAVIVKSKPQGRGSLLQWSGEGWNIYINLNCILKKIRMIIC